MNILKNKKILLIICGGISAYKSLELIRLLKKKEVEIKTILTKNSKKFITPLSVASLTQNKVYDDLFNTENEAEMDHISLSRWCDAIVIVPATANTISKLSFGKSDDLASTVVLASNKQTILAPAMNVRMWTHRATQENVNRLKNYGYLFIGPETGDMACGEYGEGKMTEPSQIINYLTNFFTINKIASKIKLKALITAGPTKEYIDPARFVSNKSSGKQGYEIARSLAKRGIDTTLISGPTNLDTPENVNIIRVETANEMFEETKKKLPADIAICAAAVSDFKIANFYNNKIKKKDKMSLDFEKNIDILEYLSNHNSLRPKLVLGFAAETNDLLKNAQEKISTKHCDWIIANDISKAGIGFGSDFNEITIVYKEKNKQNETISRRSKSEIAEIITDKVVENFIS